MRDALLYVGQFEALVTHLAIHYPGMLERDVNGAIASPPVVTGFARTPAITDGEAVMVYVRLQDDEVESWRGMPGVEIMAEVEYAGAGTAQKVYDLVFSDPAKYERYKALYPHEPYQVETGLLVYNLTADFSEPTEVAVTLDNEPHTLTMTDSYKLTVAPDVSVSVDHEGVVLGEPVVETRTITPSAWIGVLAGA